MLQIPRWANLVLCALSTMATLQVPTQAQTPTQAPAPRASTELAEFLEALPLQQRGLAPHGSLRRAAVLVGADLYPNIPGADLSGARATVTQLAEALRSYAGFAPGPGSTPQHPGLRLLTGSQVHAQAVRQAILSAGRAMTKSDDGLLLLVWAGHGWQTSGAQPEQSLLTYFSSEQGALYDTCVQVSELVSWMSEARTEARRRGVELQPVLWLDVCRTARGAPPKKVRPIPREVWQIYGAKSGQMVAAGGPDPLFAFTGTLVQQLPQFKQRGSSAGLNEVFEACRLLLREKRGPAQIPELLPPKGIELRSGPELIRPSRVTLQLRAVDAFAKTPIRSFAVRINAQQLSTTDALIEHGLAPGRALIEASAKGYVGRSDEIDLSNVGAATEIQLQLYPEIHVLRGRLVPAAVAKISLNAAGNTRSGWHRVETTSAADGSFELRAARLAGAELIVRRGSQQLERFAIRGQASGLLQDPNRQHNGVPLWSRTFELSPQTLAALDAGTVPVSADDEPKLSDFADRMDWDQAKKAMADRNWNMARLRLRRIQGDRPKIESILSQVESRWAIEGLEHLLRDGLQSGDWSKASAWNEWWSTEPRVEDPRRIRELLDTIARESIDKATRDAYEQANQANAERRLQDALRLYRQAHRDANAHYRQLIATQTERIERELYRRFSYEGFEAEMGGDKTRALAAYRRAAEFNDRAKSDVARLEKELPTAPAAPAAEPKTAIPEEEHSRPAKPSSRPSRNEPETSKLVWTASLPDDWSSKAADDVDAEGIEIKSKRTVDALPAVHAILAQFKPGQRPLNRSFEQMTDIMLADTPRMGLPEEYRRAGYRIRRARGPIEDRGMLGWQFRSRSYLISANGRPSGQLYIALSSGAGVDRAAMAVLLGRDIDKNRAKVRHAFLSLRKGPAPQTPSSESPARIESSDPKTDLPDRVPSTGIRPYRNAHLRFSSYAPSNWKPETSKALDRVLFRAPVQDRGQARPLIAVTRLNAYYYSSAAKATGPSSALRMLSGQARATALAMTRWPKSLRLEDPPTEQTQDLRHPALSSTARLVRSFEIDGRPGQLWMAAGVAGKHVYVVTAIAEKADQGRIARLATELFENLRLLEESKGKDKDQR
jgi:hypothetical protein